MVQDVLSYPRNMCLSGVGDFAILVAQVFALVGQVSRFGVIGVVLTN